MTSARDRSQSVSVRRVTPRIIINSVIAEEGYRQRALSSTAADLAARRGVFSRKHYGSIELLVSHDEDGGAHAVGRFRVENGDRCDKDEVYGAAAAPSPVHLENPEFQTRWYFKYYLGKQHQNYVGHEYDGNIFFLSIVLTDANNHSVPQYRVILWRRTGTQKICLPFNPNKPMTAKQISSSFSNMEKIEKGPREIFSPEIQKDLLLLEEQEGSVNFKFGIVYAKAGQTSDDEFFSNENGSEEFKRFIDLLGGRITLRNWDRFKGGLDVKSNTTGMESRYTVFEGHEIMFHVSTLLPYSRDNRQQVERKRILARYCKASCSKSKRGWRRAMLFKALYAKVDIFALVTYNRQLDAYRLWVWSEEAVPLFGPTLPCPPLFQDPQQFRDFLLVKRNHTLYSSTRFDELFSSILNAHSDLISKPIAPNMLNRRAFSDVFPDSPRGSRRKEEARQAEFLQTGQALKLDTIMRGDAPTSLATTGLFRREPWEPHCIYPDFPHEVVCGDSWGDRLIVGAEGGGIFLIEERTPYRALFDRSVVIRQLNVVAPHGILLFLADKGKESRVYVCRLSDFEGQSHEQTTRTKADLKNNRLEITKGCHLYALSRPGGSHLRMVIAINKRLLVVQWRHSAAWTAWCSASDTDTIDGFHYIREHQCGDIPSILTLIDGTKCDNQISVGYRNQFDLINEKNGDMLRLFHVEGSKVKLVTALDIYEDDEAELLLCYNHTAHFQKLCEETSTQFDFQWNSVPNKIVCAFPYIMGFTYDSIEIRLIVNGNLVHTMNMPKLNLLTSKSDIYFTVPAMDVFTDSDGATPPNEGLSVHACLPKTDPTPSTSDGKPLRILKIPMSCLTGQVQQCDLPAVQPPLPSSTRLAPIISVTSERTSPTQPTGERDGRLLERGGDHRPDQLHRCMRSSSGLFIRKLDQVLRSDSGSSDSGYRRSGSEGSTPPISPFFFPENIDDETIMFESKYHSH
ncbi:PREDICTED: GTPase-activating Rap/Ran-GAP domain-like protein 3 [Priapulus caudatus]|uniref:GTPase-activating Rap/Ran-GAP domain-like protein 3 n=1 Tax=Priapulus caudatus TaxID=37621 RepID=A0ABM1DNW1_PRICU|nr:PREDICTED: GTPase-activating Rap/Ran-GAP domain-like protein 3 [Priapulus caudatus]